MSVRITPLGQVYKDGNYLGDISEFKLHHDGSLTRNFEHFGYVDVSANQIKSMQSSRQTVGIIFVSVFTISCVAALSGTVGELIERKQSQYRPADETLSIAVNDLASQKSQGRNWEFAAKKCKNTAPDINHEPVWLCQGTAIQTNVKYFRDTRTETKQRHSYSANFTQIYLGNGKKEWKIIKETGKFKLAQLPKPSLDR